MNAPHLNLAASAGALQLNRSLSLPLPLPEAQELLLQGGTPSLSVLVLARTRRVEAAAELTVAEPTLAPPVSPGTSPGIAVSRGPGEPVHDGQGGFRVRGVCLKQRGGTANVVVWDRVNAVRGERGRSEGGRVVPAREATAAPAAIVHFQLPLETRMGEGGGLASMPRASAAGTAGRNQTPVGRAIHLGEKLHAGNTQLSVVGSIPCTLHGTEKPVSRVGHLLDITPAAFTGIVGLGRPRGFPMGRAACGERPLVRRRHPLPCMCRNTKSTRRPRSHRIEARSRVGLYRQPVSCARPPLPPGGFQWGPQNLLVEHPPRGILGTMDRAKVHGERRGEVAGDSARKRTLHGRGLPDGADVLGEECGPPQAWAAGVEPGRGGVGAVGRGQVEVVAAALAAAVAADTPPGSRVVGRTGKPPLLVVGGCPAQDELPVGGPADPAEGLGVLHLDVVAGGSRVAQVNGPTVESPRSLFGVRCYAYST